jgi:hypothetical protein
MNFRIALLLAVLFAFFDGSGRKVVKAVKVWDEYGNPLEGDEEDESDGVPENHLIHDVIIQALNGRPIHYTGDNRASVQVGALNSATIQFDGANRGRIRIGAVNK